VCIFQLTILDTLRGLYRAREYGFFDFATFNVEEYEHFEQVENGDLNWVMNEKFIAFAGPHGEQHPGSPTVAAQGYRNLRPDDYVPYFKRRNVTLVVRLNKPYYDSKKFTSHGIDHKDMYFLDGSNPPDPLLNNFITRAEETPGVVAVHCKAGLGRTGCCIGCYMMKHFRLTGEEIIGWLRIVRPGSIIGPQQQYMREMQTKMWREGDMLRSRIQQFLQQGGNPQNHPEFSPSVMRHYYVFTAALNRAAALASTAAISAASSTPAAASLVSGRSGAAAASLTSPSPSSKDLSHRVAQMHIGADGRISTPSNGARSRTTTPPSSSGLKATEGISSSRPTTPSSTGVRRPVVAFGQAASERAESETVTQGDMLQMRRHQQQQQHASGTTTPTSATRSQLGAAGAASFSSPSYAANAATSPVVGGTSNSTAGQRLSGSGTTPTSASRNKAGGNGVGSYFSSWGSK
jgi:protein-tyrosine phosphatase